MNQQAYRDERPLRQMQRRDDRWWIREQQLVTQRCLLERLRYKQYVRNGTLSNFMQRLGDWGRGVYLYMAVLLRVGR